MKISANGIDVEEVQAADQALVAAETANIKKGTVVLGQTGTYTQSVDTYGYDGSVYLWNLRGSCNITFGAWLDLSQCDFDVLNVVVDDGAYYGNTSDMYVSIAGGSIQELQVDLGYLYGGYGVAYLGFGYSSVKKVTAMYPEYWYSEYFDLDVSGNEIPAAELDGFISDLYDGYMQTGLSWAYLEINDNHVDGVLQRVSAQSETYIQDMIDNGYWSIAYDGPA